MEVKVITDKNVWENFLLECKDKTFLQSWNWGEFQERMGNKFWRLGAFENDRLVGIALVLKIAARRGRFLLIQHGPVGRSLETLLKEAKRIAGEEKASFIRVASLLERNKDNKRLFQSLGFREAPIHANAYEATWKLDLASSEEELLVNMRKTTRYLIRQGLKNSELEITRSENPEDVAIYDKLNKEVARHQKFVPFSFQYVKNEFEVFSKTEQIQLFFGRYKGEVVASALVIFWSGVGFYHQAALLPQYNKIPIAYLLQWEAIKEAKKRGCSVYDFWGFTDPQKYPKHPWAGPTLFKMGFGGEKFEYIKTQDLPLSNKYWLTYIFEKLRKTKRGL